MKKTTLHKSNNIIRGGDNLSVFGKRLINAIYHVIQTNVNDGNQNTIEDIEYIPLEFQYLRKIMNLSNVDSYSLEIEKAITELQQPIAINNFKDPRDGNVHKWFSVCIISEASFKIDRNKKVAHVALSPIIKWMMINTNDGNFTKIELIPIINRLRTKYSIKLYEYIKSFGGYKYIDITQNHMLKILGIPIDNKSYTNFAQIKRLLDRQIEEITKKSDLKEIRIDESKELRKDKVFRIHINKKSKKISKKLVNKTVKELAEMKRI